MVKLSRVVNASAWERLMWQCTSPPRGISTVCDFFRGGLQYIQLIIFYRGHVILLLLQFPSNPRLWFAEFQLFLVIFSVVNRAFALVLNLFIFFEVSSVSLLTATGARSECLSRICFSRLNVQTTRSFEHFSTTHWITSLSRPFANGNFGFLVFGPSVRYLYNENIIYLLKWWENCAPKAREKCQISIVLQV